MREVERLVPVFQNRANHPGSVMDLQSFGPLSDREQQMVSALMRTAAIELDLAVRHDGMATDAAAPALAVTESTLKGAERQVILQALDYCHWNQRTASRLLGISANTLGTKMRRLGIRRPAVPAMALVRTG